MSVNICFILKFILQQGMGIICVLFCTKHKINVKPYVLKGHHCKLVIDVLKSFTPATKEIVTLLI